MRLLFPTLILISLSVNVSYALNKTTPPKNYEKKIFNDIKFTDVFCPPGLKRVETEISSELEIGCRDEQGRLQGIAIRLDLKRKKNKVQTYRDNDLTHDHTVAWDENGKINYTEEKNSTIFWYDFKKRKKRIETLTQGAHKETRTWYPNDKLESLTIEEEGLPTQVLGWDENGKRIGASN